MRVSRFIAQVSPKYALCRRLFTSVNIHILLMALVVFIIQTHPAVWLRLAKFSEVDASALK